MNNVLTLDGAVVARSVSVAGHCECLCGVEVVGEVVEVQLQYEFPHKRDRSCYILIAIQMLFAKCMWGDDVVSVIVERPGDRTHVLEGLSSGYLTLGTRLLGKISHWSRSGRAVKREDAYYRSLKSFV